MHYIEYNISIESYEAKYHLREICLKTKLKIFKVEGSSNDHA